MPKTYILKLTEQDHQIFTMMVDAVLKAHGAAALPLAARATQLLNACEVTEPPQLKAVKK